jgi:L-seryl-tRNA(Ser) seleniumtransferase
MVAAAASSTVEADAEAGSRASRQDLLAPLWRALLDCDDAVVVSNNAGAVLLALSAVAGGGEVLVSRGEAVEIGGGFRIPDVVRRSGARLVEVGTTNRTYAADYAAAITPRTRAILRVHPANFSQTGFVARPQVEELAAVAREHGVLLIDDVGSGALLDTARFRLAAEPRPQDSLAAGADLVCFSTDKLLGGPQGGVIAGRAALVAAAARHPLMRALRTDKLQLAALEATLRSYLAGSATTEIPVWRMVAAEPAALQRRAVAWQASLGGDVIETTAAIGGGSLPGETLPSFGLRLPGGHPTTAARRLRSGSPAIWPRIIDNAVVLDTRSVLPENDAELIETLKSVLATSPGRSSRA